MKQERQAERDPQDPQDPWGSRVARKEARKQKARGQEGRGLWFGLGMFGLVGWSVAIPTLAGIALGVWIDSLAVSRYSWTLMLLFVGVVIGCLNAWYWVKRESGRD
ncbi:MAG: AtpZ/AtpI family protein [Desulfobacterales bacterium]